MSQHTETLRRNYQALVDASLDSIDARAAFHLAHIEEYWSRALGFLELAPAEGSSILAGDIGQIVIVATDLASPDVQAFAMSRGAPARHLSQAWETYAAIMTIGSQAAATASDALRQGAVAFRAVQRADRSVREGESRSK